MKRMIPYCIMGLLVGMYVPFTLDASVEPELIVYENYTEEVKRTVLIGVKINWTEERIIDEIYKVFPDAPIMVEVAMCESTLTHYLENGTILQGHVDTDDTGLLQINKRYHLAEATSLGLDLDDLQDNLAFGKVLYDRNGLSDWSASQPCWSE